MTGREGSMSDPLEDWLADLRDTGDPPAEDEDPPAAEDDARGNDDDQV